MGEGCLRVLVQLLGAVGIVAAVAGHHEGRQEGTKHKGDQDTGNQEGVVDTVAGLVQFWGSLDT